jgi:hypothetical protein
MSALVFAPGHRQGAAGVLSRSVLAENRCLTRHPRITCPYSMLVKLMTHALKNLPIARICGQVEYLFRIAS